MLILIREYKTTFIIEIIIIIVIAIIVSFELRLLDNSFLNHLFNTY